MKCPAAIEVLEDRTLLTTLSVSDVAMAEGDSGTTTFTFDVTIDQAIGQDVTFNFTTVADTAVAFSDFTPVNGSGKIPAGQTATTIEVPVIGNTEVELDKQFFVELSNLQAGGLPIEFDPTAHVRPGGGITELGAFDTPDLALAVQVVGNLAYVADRQSGLRVLDVSDPANITELGAFNTPGSANAVQVVGNLAYVADGFKGLRVLDVSNSANITELGNFEAPSSASAVHVVGSLAFVADGDSGLRVLDVRDPASITELGAFDTPGYAQDVQVVGNLAYVVDSTSGLRVLNVSNPANITEIGAFDMPDFAYDVQVVGSFAYVAGGFTGLWVLDVSNPANITERGTFDTPGFAWDVQVVGNLAYVADASSGLRALDVSDPASITELAAFDTPGGANDVQVVGNLAYVADTSSGLRVLNVSNPADITEIGALDIGSARAVQVVGNLAFVAYGSNGLRVLDVSNPTNVREQGAFNTPDYASDVQVVGNLAFVADRQSGLLVLDVSDPANITELGVFDTPDFANSVQVVGNLAFVADSISGILVLDVSNPANITELGTFNTFYAYDVQVVGSVAYVADHNSGLRVLDVSDVANITELGTFDTPGTAVAVQVMDNLAYVADGSSGLRVLDVSNLASITEAGIFDTQDFASGVQVVGNLVYVADGDSGLLVLDVSNPANITEVGTFDTFDFALAVQVVGNLAYVADTSDGLRVLDVSNSANITELGAFAAIRTAAAVQVVGDLAYVIDFTSGLRVLDVSNPGNIRELGGFKTLGSAFAVQVVGNLAYLADGGSALRVLDVSNPANITELGAFDTTDFAVSVQVVGNLAYVPEGFSGLRVFDVTNPANITELGVFDTPGYAYDAQVVANLAYVADRTGGLRVLDVSNPANITELGNFDTPSSADAVQVVGNLAYVVDQSSGLRVLDVSNPASITEVGAFNTPDFAYSVQVVGNLAFVAAGSRGLRVLDVSIPTSITELGIFQSTGYVNSVQVAGNLAFVADSFGFSGLRVLDLAQALRVTGTILNDDVTRLNISNMSKVEGSSGPTTFTFDVTLDRAISEDVTFDFTTVSDTALAGSDFQVVSGLGRIPAGQIATTIEVTVTGESMVESDERFFVDLSNLQAGGLSVLGVTTRGTGTIQNDDSAKVILASVDNIATQQLEGDDSSTAAQFQFSVTLDNPVQGGFTLQYFVRDGAINPTINPGQAELGEDYFVDDSQPDNQFDPSTGIGTLTFTETTDTRLLLDLFAIADEIVEADEFFHIELGAITLLDNTLDPNDVTVSEERPGDRIQQGVLLNRLNDVSDDISNLAVEFDSFVTGPNGEPNARFSIMSSNPVQGGFRVAVLTDTGGDSGFQFVGANLASDAGFADFAEGEPVRMVDIPLPANPNVIVLLGGVNPFGPGVRSEDIRTGASVPLPLREKEIVVFAAGPGGGPHIRVFDTRTNSSRFEFFAYDVTFSGGVRVAKGDVNQDGVSEIITAPGPGGGPHIKVFDGTDPNKILFSFFAYGPTFTGGVFVAAGDITGDGRADIITGADAGGGPNVKAFDGETGAEIRNFFAYGAAYSGGVRVAAGDVNGDQQADIITSPGAGGGPHVKVFDGATNAEIRSFFAYGTTFTGGVFVAAGDVNGDQQADIITGAGRGGGPHVKVFDGETSAEIRSFFAYGITFTGGVFVAAGDVNGDGRADIVTGAGPGGGPHVKVFDGTTLAELRGYFAYSPAFSGGVYLAGIFPLPTSSASAQQFASSWESPSSKGLTFPTNHTPSSSSALRLRGDLLSAPSDSLTLTQVSPLLDEAIHCFEKVYPSLNVLRDNVSVQIDDLDGDQLGTTLGTTIVLDANAAGWGWFIDPTPADDIEFQTADRDIPSQVDLLTVISHELGHIVGLQHEDDPAHLMAERLPTGIRRTLHEEDFAAIDFAFRGWTMDALE